MPLFPHPPVRPAATDAPPQRHPPPACWPRDDVARARQLADLLRARFAQTLVGQDNLRESLIVTLVAGGHILIESVPGLAKTTAAQTLATAVSGTFKRVQCTPDLMPSDLVGTQVFDFASQRFATQIGRSTRTSCCSTRSTVPTPKPSRRCWRPWRRAPPPSAASGSNCPNRSWSSATQNPIEEEGTFNLPEAQMDRFMMKAVMTYPSADEERRMLALLTQRGSDVVDVNALSHDVLSIADVEFLRKSARRVHVSDAIMRYAVDLAATTRGAGSPSAAGTRFAGPSRGPAPRASIALIRIGQAYALLSGRDYVGAGGYQGLRARGDAPTASCSRSRRWPTASPPTRSSIRWSKAVPVP